MEAAFDKDAYSPEEEINIKLSFTNVTAEPHEISPFPPIVEVRADGKRDSIVRTLPAGSGNITVQSGETTEHTLVWNQQDKQGQQGKQNQQGKQGQQGKQNQQGKQAQQDKQNQEDKAFFVAALADRRGVSGSSSIS